MILITVINLQLVCDQNLHSLPTGDVAVHGQDAFNCDEAEII